MVFRTGTAGTTGADCTMKYRDVAGSWVVTGVSCTTKGVAAVVAGMYNIVRFVVK